MGIKINKNTTLEEFLDILDELETIIENGVEIKKPLTTEEILEVTTDGCPKHYIQAMLHGHDVYQTDVTIRPQVTRVTKLLDVTSLKEICKNIKSKTAEAAEKRTELIINHIYDNYDGKYEWLFPQNDSESEIPYYYGSAPALRAVTNICKEQGFTYGNSIINKTTYFYVDTKTPTDLHIGMVVAQLISIINKLYIKDINNRSIQDVCIEKYDDTFRSVGIIDQDSWEYVNTPLHFAGEAQHAVVIDYHEDLFKAYISVKPDGKMKWNKSIINQFPNIKIAVAYEDHYKIYYRKKFVKLYYETPKQLKVGYDLSYILTICGYKNNTLIDRESIRYVINNFYDLVMINSGEHARRLAEKLPYKLAKLVLKKAEYLVNIGEIPDEDLTPYYERYDDIDDDDDSNLLNDILDD